MPYVTARKARPGQRPHAVLPAGDTPWSPLIGCRRGWRAAWTLPRAVYPARSAPSPAKAAQQPGREPGSEPRFETQSNGVDTRSWSQIHRGRVQTWTDKADQPQGLADTSGPADPAGPPWARLVPSSARPRPPAREATPAGTPCHSPTPPLAVSQRSTVTAKGAGPWGQTFPRPSACRPLPPPQRFTAKILEGAGQTYGVGMPVILYFSQHITNKAAVERVLQLRSSKPVMGSWYWDDSCGLAPTCAYFRPQSYWPTHTQVSFAGHLNGVEGAPGVYGDHTLTQSFTIGDSLIVVARPPTHPIERYRNA